MKLINHHVHTTGSDGKLSPEDTAKLAIEKGLSFICFTDHYPYPKGTDNWSKNFHSEEYYNQVQKTINRLEDKIEISFGAEIGWIPKNKDWIINEVKKRKYDYLLGAVHHLGNTTDYSINASEKNWNETIEAYKGIEELVRKYYSQLRSMIESEIFDGVAHFDLVKIWNENSKYFSENEKWYKQEVIKTLEIIKKTGICIEINTSGVRKKSKEIHPSFWILLESKKRYIPITIGSDSHYPEEIDNGLEKAIELAKKAGYDYILKFKSRTPNKVEI